MCWKIKTLNHLCLILVITCLWWFCTLRKGWLWDSLIIWRAWSVASWMMARWRSLWGEGKKERGVIQNSAFQKRKRKNYTWRKWFQPSKKEQSLSSGAFRKNGVLSGYFHQLWLDTSDAFISYWQRARDFPERAARTLAPPRLRSQPKYTHTHTLSTHGNARTHTHFLKPTCFPSAFAIFLRTSAAFSLVFNAFRLQLRALVQKPPCQKIHNLRKREKICKLHYT